MFNDSRWTASSDAVVIVAAVRHPTILRLCTSMANAVNTNPDHVATHAKRSDRSALSGFRGVGFCGPPSEPDVQLALHPALHVFMPLLRVILLSGSKRVGR